LSQDLVGHPAKKKQKNHLPSMKFSASETRLDRIFKRLFFAIVPFFDDRRLLSCFFKKPPKNLNIFNKNTKFPLQYFSSKKEGKDFQFVIILQTSGY
jgi:hypothetical protein